MIHQVCKSSVSQVLILSLFLIVLCSDVLFAADNRENNQQLFEKNSGDPAVVNNKQQRWAAFPIIANSPETGVMLGGMLFHFFPTEKQEQQASTVDILGYGTTEGQYAFAAATNIFLSNCYRLNATFSASFWQANYYNIGNDSPEDHEEYESVNYGVSMNLERRLFDLFVMEIVARYENTDMDIIEDGMLSSGNVDGAEDGEYVGVGFSLGYDTRDNTNAPSMGLLSRYEYLTFDKDLGSRLDFKSHVADFRYYSPMPIVDNSVLALAAQVKSTSGDVPFRYLPSPDGTYILRGIENGRYKDNDMISLQTEYRFPIRSNFSGTVFAEFAQVAEDFSDMEFSETKTSFGTGIRYALNPEQRFNIRADVAWVDDGIGVIVNVREAF